MGNLKGSATEQNILKAFAGESQARNRYTYFASQAKKEGYDQIAAVFEETASQEKEHAKRLFNLLQGGDLEVTAAFPAGVVGSTLENLQAAAAGENHECTAMYPEFSETARNEDLNGIARLFDSLAVAEAYHEKRYLGFAENLAAGKVFKRDGMVTWRCRNCGYVHNGMEAPAACPACAHPQGYFEVLVQSW